LTNLPNELLKYPPLKDKLEKIGTLENMKINEKEKKATVKFSTVSSALKAF